MEWYTNAFFSCTEFQSEPYDFTAPHVPKDKPSTEWDTFSKLLKARFQNNFLEDKMSNEIRSFAWSPNDTLETARISFISKAAKANCDKDLLLVRNCFLAALPQSIKHYFHIYEKNQKIQNGQPSLKYANQLHKRQNRTRNTITTRTTTMLLLTSTMGNLILFLLRPTGINLIRMHHLESKKQSTTMLTTNASSSSNQKDVNLVINANSNTILMQISPNYQFPEDTASNIRYGEKRFSVHFWQINIKMKQHPVQNSILIIYIWTLEPTGTSFHSLLFSSTSESQSTRISKESARNP